MAKYVFSFTENWIIEMLTLTEMIARRKLSKDVSIDRWNGRFCLTNHAVQTIEYVDSVALVTASKDECSIEYLSDELGLYVFAKLRGGRGVVRWLIALNKKDKPIKCGAGVSIDMAFPRHIG